LRVFCFTTISPCVTCPSDTSTTCPSFRTHSTVVARVRPADNAAEEWPARASASAAGSLADVEAAPLAARSARSAARSAIAWEERGSLARRARVRFLTRPPGTTHSLRELCRAVLPPDDGSADACTYQQQSLRV
jgi:hypothetical protein